jgi:hypothetical protein
MNKYTFARANTILPYPKGTHTFDNCADIEYEFNATDVRIEINNFYFCAEDLNDLINFLTAMKTEIESANK